VGRRLDPSCGLKNSKELEFSKLLQGKMSRIPPPAIFFFEELAHTWGSLSQGVFSMGEAGKGERILLPLKGRSSLGIIPICGEKRGDYPAQGETQVERRTYCATVMPAKIEKTQLRAEFSEMGKGRSRKNVQGLKLTVPTQILPSAENGRRGGTATKKALKTAIPWGSCREKSIGATAP